MDCERLVLLIQEIKYQWEQREPNYHRRNLYRLLWKEVSAQMKLKNRIIINLHLLFCIYCIYTFATFIYFLFYFVLYLHLLFLHINYNIISFTLSKSYQVIVYRQNVITYYYIGIIALYI